MVRTEDAITRKRMDGVGKSDAAIAKLLLKEAAGLAGKHIRCSVRVAPLQHTQRAGGRSAIFARVLVCGEIGKKAIERGGEGDGVVFGLLEPVGDLVNKLGTAGRVNALHVVVNAGAAAVAAVCGAARCGGASRAGGARLCGCSRRAPC